MDRFNEADPATRDAEMGQTAAFNIVCNVHGGAMKRRKYGQVDLYDLSNPVCEAFLSAAKKYRANLADRQRVVKAERESENIKNAKVRNIRDWADYQETTYVAAGGEDLGSSYSGRRAFKYTVRQSDGKSPWDGPNVDVTVLPIEPDENWWSIDPTEIKAYNCGSMTPQQARLMAGLLIQAAEQVEADNKTRWNARAERKHE